MKKPDLVGLDFRISWELSEILVPVRFPEFSVHYAVRKMKRVLKSLTATGRCTVNGDVAYTRTIFKSGKLSHAAFATFNRSVDHTWRTDLDNSCSP